MYSQLSKRWGDQCEDSDTIELLSKKDQQIRRLQAEVQQERRRAENALKMLESYRSINSQAQQASEGLRSEMSRRMRAQEEVKKLQKRNQQLENNVRACIDQLKARFDKKQKYCLEGEYNQEDQQ